MPFPRDLWAHGQADLAPITEIFRSLAPECGALLWLNPDIKYPHPARSLRKRVDSTVVRVELALRGSTDGSFPERLEEFRYVLYVFRTPRESWLHAILHPHRRDPTEWRIIGVYSAADVREAAPRLVDALEAAARRELAPRVP
jgi:hypothetical protein